LEIHDISKYNYATKLKYNIDVRYSLSLMLARLDVTMCLLATDKKL